MILHDQKTETSSLGFRISRLTLKLNNYNIYIYLTCYLSQTVILSIPNLTGLDPSFPYHWLDPVIFQVLYSGSCSCLCFCLCSCLCSIVCVFVFVLVCVLVCVLVFVLILSLVLSLNLLFLILGLCSWFSVVFFITRCILSRVLFYFTFGLLNVYIILFLFYYLF